MSTTLPEDAPTGEQEAPSVEDTAPDAPGEVDEESVDDGEAPNVVPADRFNGLMGRFNRTQSELQAERERVAELEARLNERESEREESPDVTTEPSELEARVNQLTEMLLSERLENARTAALQDHPEAAPFADLIVADTPEDIREMTRLIADRVKTASAPTTTTDEVEEEQETETQETASTASAEGEETQETQEQTAPPVSGGGAAFSSEASADERVAEAIASGNFSDFLTAKWESQAMRDGADLTVS